MESAIKIGTGIDGLDVYREIDYRKDGFKEPIIHIFYYQYKISPNGTKLMESIEHKRVFIIDIPAVMKPGQPILISEAVYDEQDPSQIITPAQFNYDVPPIEDKPAFLGYTRWREKIVLQEEVGKTYDEIIVGAMNSLIASLPINIKTDYAIGT